MITQNIPLPDMLAGCAAACNHCSTACLGEKDVQMMATYIKLDMDCAQMCATTAAFVAKGSLHASIYSKNVLKFAASVHRNAKSMRTWNIAGDVRKRAGNALKPAAKLLSKSPELKKLLKNQKLFI